MPYRTPVRDIAFSLNEVAGLGALLGAGAYPDCFDHPDVRRTLALIKAKVEAARGICFSTAVAADTARHGADEATRAAAALREEVLTPIAKAWSTDLGVEAASMALQVQGGMGFIEETGAAQHYRDARILPIYEGTNGIQAMDLAGRKLGMEGGAGIASLLDDVAATAAALDGELSGVSARLQSGVDAARQASDWLKAHKGSADALSGATAYLGLMGDVVGGWMLAKGALAAAAKIKAGDTDPYWPARIALARVYADQVLSLAPGKAAAVTAGGASFKTLTAGMLGAL